MIIVALLAFALAAGLTIAAFYVFDDVEAAFSVALLSVIAATGITVAWGSSHYNERVITCHVEDKDRGGDKGSYRVYTTDCGTLANKDSWLRGKTNSADVWADIHPGQDQRLRVVGWRFGLLSQFPNVLAVEATP